MSRELVSSCYGPQRRGWRALFSCWDPPMTSMSLHSCAFIASTKPELGAQMVFACPGAGRGRGRRRVAPTWRLALTSLARQGPRGLADEDAKVPTGAIARPYCL